MVHGWPDPPELTGVTLTMREAEQDIEQTDERVAHPQKHDQQGERTSESRISVTSVPVTVTPEPVGVGSGIAR